MEKMILLGILVTLFYVIFKMIEMKYIQKEAKPLKEIVRDAAYVFLSSIVAGFIIFQFNGSIGDFFNILTQTKTLDPAATQVFTDEPTF
jgi:hypothetical protein